MISNQNLSYVPDGDPDDPRKQIGPNPMLGMALLHGLGGILFIAWSISGASAFAGLMLTLTVLVVLGNYSLKSTFVQKEFEQRRNTNEVSDVESDEQQTGVQPEVTSHIQTLQNPMESPTVEHEKDKLARVISEVIAQEDQLATDILTNNANSPWGSEIEQLRKAG